jgi:hypothetical protein
LRSSTTIDRRNIHGRGGSVFDAVGAETSDEGGDVGWIGCRNGPVPRSVVLDGETEILGTDRVDLNMVELREAVDKESEVRGVSIFDTEVVDNKGKGDVASGVAEETGGGSFVKVRALRSRTRRSLESLPAQERPHMLLRIAK